MRAVGRVECECVYILRRVGVGWVISTYANQEEWIVCHRKGRFISISERGAIQSLIVVFSVEVKRKTLGRC